MKSDLRLILTKIMGRAKWWLSNQIILKTHNEQLQSPELFFSQVDYTLLDMTAEIAVHYQHDVNESHKMN